MIITIGATTICDGADRSVDKSSGPTNVTINGAIKMQPAEYLRALHSEMISRDNRNGAISFTINRLLASEEAATAWAFLHAATVTRAGTLTITLGATATQMLNSVIQNISCTPIGRSVKVTYNIIGGQLEAV